MNIVVSIAIVGITLALALVAYGVLALRAFWIGYIMKTGFTGGVLLYKLADGTKRMHIVEGPIDKAYDAILDKAMGMVDAKIPHQVGTVAMSDDYQVTWEKIDE